MNGTATWWDKEIELVERPKEKVQTVREKAVSLLSKTMDGKHSVKIPKARINNLTFLYAEARKRKLRMSMETNGKWSYLRWEKP